MEKTLMKRVEAVAKNLRWSIENEGDGYLRFSHTSPAGEEFSFSVSSDDLIHQVQECADAFDVSEHVAMWLQERDHFSGVPAAEILVEDARKIQSMLNTLAEKLGEL